MRCLRFRVQGNVYMLAENKVLKIQGNWERKKKVRKLLTKGEKNMEKKKKISDESGT